MSSFSSRLASLCAGELAEGRKDPERMAEMLEQLTSSLAFTIAVFSQGNMQMMSTLAEGCTSHLMECAVDEAKVGHFLATDQQGDQA